MQQFAFIRIRCRENLSVEKHEATSSFQHITGCFNVPTVPQSGEAKSKRTGTHKEHVLGHATAHKKLALKHRQPQSLMK